MSNWPITDPKNDEIVERILLPDFLKPRVLPRKKRSLEEMRSDQDNIGLHSYGAFLSNLSKPETLKKTNRPSHKQYGANNSDKHLVELARAGRRQTAFYDTSVGDPSIGQMYAYSGKSFDIIANPSKLKDISQKEVESVLIDAMRFGIEIGASIERDAELVSKERGGFATEEEILGGVKQKIFSSIHGLGGLNVTSENSGKIEDALAPVISKVVQITIDRLIMGGIHIVPRQWLEILKGRSWVQFFIDNEPKKYEGYTVDGKAIAYFLHKYCGYDEDATSKQPDQIDLTKLGFSQPDLRYYDMKLFKALDAACARLDDVQALASILPASHQESELRRYYKK